MKSIKRLVDILLFVFFILLMGNHLIHDFYHELIGVIAIVLLITHNILNIRWYKNVFKGKYTSVRLFQTTINMLLLLLTILVMISSMMISVDIFSFLNIPTTMLGRNLHMLSTSWIFIIMSIHVGIHWMGIFRKLSNYFKNNVLEYVYYFIEVIIVGGGIYFFIKQNLISDMLLLSSFKMYDYNQSPIVFYLEITIILLAITIMTYYVMNILMKRKLPQK